MSVWPKPAISFPHPLSVANTDGAGSTAGNCTHGAMSSAVLLWQHCGFRLVSPSSQMRKLRPMELEWRPRSYRESSLLPTLHSDLTLTMTSGGAVAGWRRGWAWARRSMNTLHRDTVLPLGTQPHAAAAGAVAHPPGGAPAGAGEKLEVRDLCEATGAPGEAVVLALRGRRVL